VNKTIGCYLVVAHPNNHIRASKLITLYLQNIGPWGPTALYDSNDTSCYFLSFPYRAFNKQRNFGDFSFYSATIFMWLWKDLDDRKIIIPLQAGAEETSLCNKVKDRLETHPAFYSRQTRGSLAGDKSARTWSWTLTWHRTKFKNDWSYN